MARPHGFTLVELLIAVLVLAIAGSAVSSRVSETFTQTYSLERRTVGHMVAENALARLELEQRFTDAAINTGTDRDRAVMGRRDWLVVTEVLATTHPWLRRVEIDVYEMVDGDEIGPVDVVEAFVGRY